MARSVAGSITSQVSALPSENSEHVEGDQTLHAHFYNQQNSTVPWLVPCPDPHFPIPRPSGYKQELGETQKRIRVPGPGGCLLVGPSCQLPDVRMEGHVLHWGLQVVQVVLVKRLPKHVRSKQSHVCQGRAGRAHCTQGQKGRQGLCSQGPPWAGRGTGDGSSLVLGLNQVSLCVLVIFSRLKGTSTGGASTRA